MKAPFRFLFKKRKQNEIQKKEKEKEYENNVAYISLKDLCTALV